MSRSPGAHNPSPIGISIDRRLAYLAQPARAGASWLEATLALPTEPWDEAAWTALAQQLTGVIERRGFRGGRVAVALPLWAHSSVSVQLPPRTSGAPLDRIATTQLSEALGAAPEQLASAWWEIPTPANAPRRPAGAPAPLTVIVSGGRLSWLEALGHALADAGLEPVAVLPRSWCLARGLVAARTAGDDAGTTATLELCFHGALLTICRAGEVAFERALPEHGIESLVGQMVEKLGVDERAALLMALSPGDENTFAAIRSHAPTAALVESASGLREAFTRNLTAEVMTSFEYCGATNGLSVGSLAVAGPSRAIAESLARHVQAAGFAGGTDTAAPSAAARGAAMVGSCSATRVPQEAIA